MSEPSRAASQIGRDAVAQLGFHGDQHRFLRVPELAGQKDLARDDVARARIGRQHAGRRDGQRRVAEADAVDEFDDARRAHQGVAAAGHRGGAGMALEALEGHLEPALALPMGDDADVDPFVFQDRPLLDVELEHGADLAAAAGHLALEADARQLVAEALAVAVLDRIGLLQRVGTGEDAGGHHGGREPGPFLVGPVGEFDRVLGPHIEIVQRAEHLEPGQHAEDAVELAAGRLRVEVAAHHHGREMILGAFAPREHVAHGVDGHGQAGGRAPAGEEVASLLVEVREGQAIAAALGGAADLRHLHQAVPEARSVDAEVGQIWHEELASACAVDVRRFAAE